MYAWQEIEMWVILTCATFVVVDYATITMAVSPGAYIILAVSSGHGSTRPVTNSAPESTRPRVNSAGSTRPVSHIMRNARGDYMFGSSTGNAESV